MRGLDRFSLIAGVAGAAAIRGRAERMARRAEVVAKENCMLVNFKDEKNVESSWKI
jgi:hypothetical protein